MVGDGVVFKLSSSPPKPSPPSTACVLGVRRSRADVPMTSLFDPDIGIGVYIVSAVWPYSADSVDPAMAKFALPLRLACTLVCRPFILAARGASDDCC